MKVTVKFFALARQQAGCESLEVQLPAGSTVAGLRSALVGQIPSLQDLLDHAMIAVNQQYAQNEETLPADAEVAVIPPVSGG